MKKTYNNLIYFLLQNTPIVLFLLIFLLFGILSPDFLRYQSLENSVKQSSYIGIVAVGMMFVLLTGGIDLSVGSNMYVSAVVAGLCIQHFSAPIWVGVIVCLLVGLTFGAVNAFAVTKLGVIPFVVTLATMVAGRGIGLMFSQSRAVNFPDSITGIGSTEFLRIIPWPIIIFGIVVLSAWLVLHQTTLGKQLYAVGHNLDAARKAGIPTNRVRATAFVLCGLFASLGGLISVAQSGNVNAGFGKLDEFDAIAAAVLGGVSLFGGIGKVFPGVVLGAVIFQIVSTGLTSARIDLYLHDMISAAVIFLAVLFDSLRSSQLKKMQRRHIRVEEE